MRPAGYTLTGLLLQGTTGTMADTTLATVMPTYSLALDSLTYPLQTVMPTLHFMAGKG